MISYIFLAIIISFILFWINCSSVKFFSNILNVSNIHNDLLELFLLAATIFVNDVIYYFSIYYDYILYFHLIRIIFSVTGFYLCYFHIKSIQIPFQRVFNLQILDFRLFLKLFLFLEFWFFHYLMIKSEFLSVEIKVIFFFVLFFIISSFDKNLGIIFTCFYFDFFLFFFPYVYCCFRKEKSLDLSMYPFERFNEIDDISFLIHFFFIGSKSTK